MLKYKGMKTIDQIKKDAEDEGYMIVIYDDSCINNIEIGTRVKHPTHGYGNIVETVNQFTVVVKYDIPTSWGNQIEQSICNLEVIR